MGCESDQNTDRTARRAAFTDWLKFESDIDMSLSNFSIGAEAPAATFGKTAFADFASARYKYAITDDNTKSVPPVYRPESESIILYSTKGLGLLRSPHNTLYPMFQNLIFFYFCPGSTLSPSFAATPK